MRWASTGMLWLLPAMAPMQGTGRADALMPEPTGPFSAWPPGSRAAAIKGVSFRCSLTSIMALGNYGGPRDAAKPGAQAFAFACMVHQMPADWPDRPDVLGREQAAYRSAKALDPGFPDPERLFPPSSP